MRVLAPLGVSPVVVKVPGVLIVRELLLRPGVVEPKMMFPVEMLPGAVKAIAPPFPVVELAFREPLLVLMLPVLLVRVMVPPLPLAAELELRFDVIMLPGVVKAIAPPFPVVELALREPPLVSMFPALLVRVMVPPLPLTAELELRFDVIMLPVAERAIVPPLPVRELVLSVPAIVLM